MLCVRHLGPLGCTAPGAAIPAPPRRPPLPPRGGPAWPRALQVRLVPIYAKKPQRRENPISRPPRGRISLSRFIPHWPASWVARCCLRGATSLKVFPWAPRLEIHVNGAGGCDGASSTPSPSSFSASSIRGASPRPRSSSGASVAAGSCGGRHTCPQRRR